MKTYQIIYLWKGERHRLLKTFTKLEDAKSAIVDVRLAGFQAWIE